MAIPNIRGKAWVGAAAGGAMALAAGLAHVMEGRVYHTYFDIAHVRTICDGHTGRDVKDGMVADDAMCDQLLTGDLSVGFAAIDKYVRQPEDLPAPTRAAAADFVLHFGTEAFRTSSFRRLLNFKDPSSNVQYRLHHRLEYIERDVVAACNSLLLWNKFKDPATGRMTVAAGLIRRQEAERHLCLGEPW